MACGNLCGKHKFITLQYCRLEVGHGSQCAKIGLLVGLCYFLESLGVNLFFFFFLPIPASGSCSHSLALGSFPYL